VKRRMAPRAKARARRPKRMVMARLLRPNT
jgi:hypothetical protein